MLSDYNIGKGFIFGFINALPGSCFNETSDTAIFRNYRKPKLNRESVEDGKRLTKGMPEPFRY